MLYKLKIAYTDTYYAARNNDNYTWADDFKDNDEDYAEHKQKGDFENDSKAEKYYIERNIENYIKNRIEEMVKLEDFINNVRNCLESLNKNINCLFKFGSENKAPIKSIDTGYIDKNTNYMNFEVQAWNNTIENDLIIDNIYILAMANKDIVEKALIDSVDDNSNHYKFDLVIIEE